VVHPTDTLLTYSEHSLPEPMSALWHNYGRLFLKGFLLGGYNKCGKCTHNHKRLCEINETPENLFIKNVVKRTEFLLDIFENKVKVVYYPYKIEGTTVYTKDDIIEDVDIIVCATGFKKEFPFLDKEIYEGDFIKKMIPKNATNIAFIGFARPTMGSIAVIAEMQSWWVESYFQNKLNYSIRKPIFRERDVLNITNEHIDTLAVGCFYIKDLAKDMNIEPNMFYLFFTDFELFKKIYTGSCHPMIYRIHGIKSYPDAREILMGTFPDYDSHNSKQKLYFWMFVLFHLLFIVGCIIIAFIMTWVTNIFLKMNVNMFNNIFWVLSILIIFIFYKYF
jgi:hypothetical protein